MCSIARGTKDNDTIPRHWDTAGQRRVEPVLRLTPPHNIRKEKHINMSSKDQQRLCQGISGSQPFCDRSGMKSFYSPLQGSVLKKAMIAVVNFFKSVAAHEVLRSFIAGNGFCSDSLRFP
jgi:CDGSH-type Zn-finger protein